MECVLVNFHIPAAVLFPHALFSQYVAVSCCTGSLHDDVWVLQITLWQTCSNFKYVVCSMYVCLYVCVYTHFVLTAVCMYVCCVCPVESLITGHALNVASTTRASTKCTQFSLQEWLHSTNKVHVTANVTHTKSLKNLEILSVLNMRHCKWKFEVKEGENDKIL